MSAAPASSLRDEFVRWQCGLRQKAVRQAGGRPGAGMRPRVAREDGAEIARAITVLLLPRNPAAVTDQFRHIVRRTHDPWERYVAGLRMLSGTYYQHPEGFSGTMTALFPAESGAAATLAAEGRCVLEFQEGLPSEALPPGRAEEGPRRCRFACIVHDLPVEHPSFQATAWHNLLFNPEPPPSARVLAFFPDWAQTISSGQAD